MITEIISITNQLTQASSCLSASCTTYKKKIEKETYPKPLEELKRYLSTPYKGDCI